MKLLDISTSKHKNVYTIVDDEDFEYLSQWKWHISDSGYAVRTKHQRIKKNKYGSKIIRLHIVVNKTPENMFTDHINRNKLDNRKCNLRTVTKSQNGFNVACSRNNKTGCTGVHFDTWSQKWRAEMKLRGKKITLGRWDSLSDAIKARKEGEIKYHVL